MIVVLGAADMSLFLQEEQRTKFMEECARLRQRVSIATRQPLVLASARKMGIRVLDSSKQLRHALAHHPQRDEALRVFSPNLWRQMWRSRLQSVGLLTLPRLRILILLILSVGLFLFVIFRLLPSVEIRVWPRGDMATQSMNVLLVQSGATQLPSHIRTLPINPLELVLHSSVTSDQISKRFTGTNAEVPMTIVNGTSDPLALQKGTRLRNQAGMIFRIQKWITVPPNGTMSVRAKADDLDEYGEVIGERGNMPAGVKWELPGLPEDERKLVYGENRVPATGGKTSYRTVLQKVDIDTARKRLEQALMADAKTKVEDKVASMNLLTGGQQYRVLMQDQLVTATYTGFVLPVDQLNKEVKSITVEGALHYRVLAYDASAILDMIQKELVKRIEEDKKLLPQTVGLQHMDIRVFDYADDLSWIKATAELSATEQFILDPLTSPGARFARDVRAKVTGLPRDEALRIVKNLPEVEKAEIKIWPPWSRLLPSIPSSISIVAM